MSDFEFLSVFVSIVVGLALTRLLAGLGQAYHYRRSTKMDAVHVAWTVNIFIIVILNWWIFLLWRDFEGWTFLTFFLVTLWTTALYTMALALFPPGVKENEDYAALFSANRTWLLTTWVTFIALDVLLAAIRDGGVPDTFFLMYVGHYFAIGIVGIVVRNRTYDLVAAWYIVLTVAAWSFGVRSTLF